MSLCDTCRDPGACCRTFTLWTEGPRPYTHKEAEQAIIREDLPFYMKSKKGAKINVVGCSHISATGRCNIYEDRPALCRDFAAGVDALCVETPNREDEQRKLEALVEE